jgi:hypothetical protein
MMNHKAPPIKTARRPRGALIAVCSIALLFLLIMGSGCAVMSKKFMPPSPTPIPTTQAPVIITPATDYILKPIVTAEETLIPIIPAPTIEAIKEDGSRDFNENLTLSAKLNAGREMRVYVTPYRYQFRKSFYVWDTVASQWLLESPGQGMIWCFIFVNVWEDDSKQNYSMPLDGWGPSHFWLQVASQLIRPYQEDRHIYGVESESNLFKNSYEVPYGTEWRHDAELKRRVPAPLERLVNGKSNAWDGYLIFPIGDDTNPADLLFLGNFDQFGSAFWRLKGGDVFSYFTANRIQVPPIIVSG